MLAGAAFNFLWQLNSSSFFVDETLSIDHSLPAWRDLIDTVIRTEITPPTYFLALNKWLYRFGTEEWVARLPSALAGIALVAAIAWLGWLVAGRRAAVAAAALGAMSPLLLQYAQQARVYVFLLLASTLAVAATLQALRDERRRGRWLAAGALAAAIAVLLHYTSLFVVGPLCLWVLTRGELPRRWRAAFVASSALASSAVVPFLVSQSDIPNGLQGIAVLNLLNSVTVLGTPFDGRTRDELDLLRWLAAAVTIGAVVAAARLWPRERHHERLLLLAVALAPLAADFALALGGEDVLGTRYTSIAAPFLLVLLALVVTAIPRPAGLVLLAAALALSLAGTAASHRTSGFYLDARGVMGHVVPRLGAGDVILLPPNPGANIPLTYYGRRLQAENLPLITATDTATIRRLMRERVRLWLVGEAAAIRLSALRAGLAPLGYEPLELLRFEGVPAMAVVPADPLPADPARR